MADKNPIQLEKDPKVANWGVPSVVIREEGIGVLSYFPEVGIIRCVGPEADFQIPESLFGAFLTALKNDADAVANGLTPPAEEPRINLPAEEVTIDPPQR